jgi:hypothetical protein
MPQKEFDLKEFLGSLNLPEGKKITKIEAHEEEPDSFYIDVLITEAAYTAVLSVRWMADERIIRTGAAFKLDFDTEDTDVLMAILDSMNGINEGRVSYVSKLFMQTLEDPTGALSFTCQVPESFVATEDGHAVFALLFATNVARMLNEVAVIGEDLDETVRRDINPDVEARYSVQ